MNYLAQATAIYLPIADSAWLLFPNAFTDDRLEYIHL